MNPYERFPQMPGVQQYLPQAAPPVSQIAPAGPTFAAPANPQPGMMYASGGPIAPGGLPRAGDATGTGMNWGGLLGGQQHPWGNFDVRGAVSQFRDARQDWREGGRVGERPRFRNFLFPDGMQQGAIPAPMSTPLVMPPPGGQPQALPPQIGTGLGVGGLIPPTSPFTLPGYGG